MSLSATGENHRLILDWNEERYAVPIYTVEELLAKAEQYVLSYQKGRVKCLNKHLRACSSRCLFRHLAGEATLERSAFQRSVCD